MLHQIPLCYIFLQMQCMQCMQHSQNWSTACICISDPIMLCFVIYNECVNGFQKKTKVLCLRRDYGLKPVVHSHRTGMQHTNPQMSNQFCWERCDVITLLVVFRKFTKWAWTLLNYQDIPIGQMDVSVTWSYYTKWSPYHWLFFVVVVCFGFWAFSVAGT